MSSEPVQPQPATERNPTQSVPAASRTPTLRGRFDASTLLLGPDGLRAGWSILLFFSLLYLLSSVLAILVGSIVSDALHLRVADRTALSSILGESEWTAALLLSMAMLAKLEGRRVRDFYLGGPRFAARLALGLVSGFAALSLLVGALALGGWIHFGPPPAPHLPLLRHAGSWAIAFALVGFTEEGAFRCYLQFTLTRGIRFWGAVAAECAFCLVKIVHGAGYGDWGIYLIAALGFLPVLAARMGKLPGASFWQAAWVSSTAFAFIHTGNHGENWIGIFAAGAIGYVFCVSVWLTGSAWWAIGYHAAWDWAETFFYGTADSGFVPRGHLFTTTPAGSALWSGGADGPEGSLLVLPVILLLLLFLFLVFRRRSPDIHWPASPTLTPEQPVNS